jgi:hypothetical protein
MNSYQDTDGCPDTQVGSISIKSDPSGANVFVDGVSKGTSPKTVSDLSPGSHTVKCSLFNYKDVEKTVSVSTDGITNVVCSLSKPFPWLKFLGYALIAILLALAVYLIIKWLRKPKPVAPVVKEKPRFCMGCGTRMELKDKKCMECGAAPQQFTGDAKSCKNCEARGKKTYNPATAKFCRECGASQPQE